MLLALFNEASLTPCFSAMPPRVSPDLTLYFDGLLLDELFELEYDPFEPGMVSVWPTWIFEPFILLASLIDASLTPCLWAILPKVSPDLTLYFVVELLLLELE